MQGISALLYINEEDKTPFQVRYITSKYEYFSYIFLIFSAIYFITNTETSCSPQRKESNLRMQISLLGFSNSLKNGDLDFLNGIRVIIFKTFLFSFKGVTRRSELKFHILYKNRHFIMLMFVFFPEQWFLLVSCTIMSV